MLTCEKIYRDIPIAHRQPRHSGHCALIHGHNWTITLTFACSETDKNGFVVDFGRLGFIKEWIDHNLDHACMFTREDGEKQILLNQFGHLFKSYELEDTSCEGIARHLYEVFKVRLKEEFGPRVVLTKVRVAEDSKNSATFQPTQTERVV